MRHSLRLRGGIPAVFAASSLALLACAAAWTLAARPGPLALAPLDGPAVPALAFCAVAGYAVGRRLGHGAPRGVTGGAFDPADAARDAILGIDWAGRIRYANAAVLRVLGHHPEELIGRALVTLAPGRDRERHESGLRSLLGGGGASVGGKSFACAAVRSDGREVEVEVSLGTARGPDGVRLTVVARSATGRERAIRREHREEARRKRLYDQTPAMLFAVGADGTVLAVNDFGARQLGHERDELLGGPVGRVFHPEDRAAAAAQVAACLAAPGQTRVWELRKVRRDGSVLWVRETARASRFHGGRPAVLIVCEDITPLHRTLEALRDSEERYRTLADATSDVVSLHDARGRFLYVSPAIEKLTGEAAGGLLGTDAFAAAHPEDLPAVEEALRRCLAGEAVEIEWRRLLRGGGQLWLATRVTVLLDGSGGVDRLVCSSRDITARRHAQAELRDSEERFRAVVEHAADALFVHDVEGRFLDVNQSACESLGYTREELLEMCAWDVETGFDPKELARLWSPPGQAAPVTARGVHRRKDGSVFPVEVRLGRFELRGRPLLLAIARDITERLRAEEAIRASEAKFRAIFSAAAVGVAVGDLHGHIVESNQTFASLLGYAPDDLCWRKLTELAHPDDRRLVTELLGPVLRGERDAGAAELRYRRPDGAVVCAEVTVSSIRGADGTPECMVAVLHDVTARREADAALRESERRVRRITENIPGMVYQFLLRPDGSAAFPYVSDGAREIYDIEPAEIREDALRILTIVHPDDRPSFRSSVADSAATLQPWRWEGRVRVGGEERWVRGASRPERQEDGSILWDGMLMDVTEHRRVEAALGESRQQLLHAQKMEAVGRLAGGVAHDFNNMLTAIKGNAQLLSLELGPDDPLRCEVEEIERAADRSTHLTRQLLAFSRRQMMQPQVMDLNASVRAMESMLRRLIGKDVDLITSLEPLLEPVVADPGQVEQVILNLAVNARDAMPAGGRLRVETRNARLSEADAAARPYLRPGDYVVMRVADSGSGMDEDTLGQIFEPFFTTKEPGKGTGLGLSTVYGIVKQSGGYVWAESRPGEGAAFTVCLPRAEAEPAGECGAGPPAAAPGGSETILVVEDEEAVRQLACKVLARSGYRVLAAPGPADALAHFQGGGDAVHLLLTDMVMPGMSGRELIARLRERAPGLKVLCMTGYSVEMFELPPQEGERLLNKPFSPDVLVRTVREVLDA